jgi:hypothetical protein
MTFYGVGGAFLASAQGTTAATTNTTVTVSPAVTIANVKGIGLTINERGIIIK